MSLSVRPWMVAILPLVLCLSVSGVAEAASDFGAFLQGLLFARSFEQFGVVRPLDASSSTQITKEQMEANALALVTLSPSLKARIVTSTPLALNIDMIALWPDDEHPTHLFACNEGETKDAGVIRVNLANGQTGRGHRHIGLGASSMPAASTST